MLFCPFTPLLRDALAFSRQIGECAAIGPTRPSLLLELVIPAQLNLYEPASSNRNTAYSRKKAGTDFTVPPRHGKLQRDEGLSYSYSV
jgi:hypothetical protein